jgi:hypothetical protein
MAAHALSTHADASDPLQDAADAVGTAVQSVSQGASEALPAVGRFVSRVIYTASYAVSYGVVFPAMLVVRAIPKENAMVRGLVDGALAARAAVEGWGTAAADDEMADSDTEESVHERDGQASGATSHRRRGGRRRTSPKTTRSSRKK